MDQLSGIFGDEHVAGNSQYLYPDLALNDPSIRLLTRPSAYIPLLRDPDPNEQLDRAAP